MDLNLILVAAKTNRFSSWMINSLMESSRVHLSWLDCNAVTFKSKWTLDSWSSHEWRIELRIKTRSWWLLIHSRYSILNSRGNHQTGMAFVNVLSHWPSTLDTWLLWKVKALDQVLSNIVLFLKGNNLRRLLFYQALHAYNRFHDLRCKD